MFAHGTLIVTAEVGKLKGSVNIRSGSKCEILAEGKCIPRCLRQRVGRIGAEGVIRHFGDKDGGSRSALRAGWVIVAGGTRA
jgi:hypothetical protein